MISLNTYGVPRDVACGYDAFAVHPSDMVFVKATQCNRVVLERSFSGFSSLQELIASVGAVLADTAGLVTLHMRNRDKGCSVRRAVRFRHAAPLFGVSLSAGA